MFFNQGEMRTAPSRLLVHRSVADRVSEAVVARARALRVGDPLDPATETGARSANTTSTGSSATSAPPSTTAPACAPTAPAPCPRHRRRLSPSPHGMGLSPRSGAPDR
ncbi:aldehyde dehydrogenase family protein [Kitasatospora sp. NPDC096204]|uniref:aldehyde dehydrogenase family protein n=1 Tax=Kitasatospora sp. NPDC096204 TaxID=3364094 RepID=UPI00382CBCC9